MKSNAQGQLLGYSLQFPRALFRLIEVGPGGSVAIEVHGDVASISPDGNVLAEEDKSSINRNPLTNRSVDLWKTFFNWVNAVINQELVLDKTQFVLYCNQNGDQGLVDIFHAACTPEMAEAAIEAAKAELGNLTESHPAFRYFDFLINEQTEVFSSVMQRFELEIGEKAAFDDVRLSFKKLSIHENSIPLVMNEVLGWLQKKVLNYIATKEAPIVHWEEYDHHIKVLFLQIRQQELIDFTFENRPCGDSIAGVIRTRPTYIKQLDLINSPHDDLIEAVSDYMRAETNRNKWIENEIMDERAAADFEDKLKTFWKNTRSDIELTLPEILKEDRGKILLSRCQSRNETIRGMQPPNPTVQGTYHALANMRCVGWHPSWESLIDKKGGEDGAVS